jgi:hypothetical protein
MTVFRSLQWGFVVGIFAVSGLPALGDEINVGEPLIQANFDQLIPTSYPTISPKFNRLRPTTLPLIDPGIARVHITENLVYPLEQPLLLTNEVSGFSAAAFGAGVYWTTLELISKRMSFKTIPTMKYNSPIVRPARSGDISRTTSKHR